MSYPRSLTVVLTTIIILQSCSIPTCVTSTPFDRRATTFHTNRPSHPTPSPISASPPTLHHHSIHTHTPIPALIQTCPIRPPQTTTTRELGPSRSPCSFAATAAAANASLVPIRTMVINAMAVLEGGADGPWTRVQGFRGISAEGQLDFIKTKDEFGCPLPTPNSILGVLFLFLPFHFHFLMSPMIISASGDVERTVATRPR